MAKEWGLEWRLVPPKGRESCRWQSLEAAWVAVTLGHQGDITKIVVTASDGRYEVVDGYEEGLSMARRWRVAWVLRPNSDPRLAAARPSGSSLAGGSSGTVGAGSPAATTAGPGDVTESRPQRPSGRHPVVSVGSFASSGASADRPTLPGDVGPFGRASALSEDPGALGGRPLRHSLPPRARMSSSSLSPPAALPPLSPATLAPPTQLPEIPATRSNPRLSARRPDGGPPVPGPLRPRPPLLGSLSPIPPAGVAPERSGDGEDDGVAVSVQREFGGRSVPSGKRSPPRSVPGAAREPAPFGRGATRTPGASAETRSPEPDTEDDTLPPPVRPPRR